MEIYKSRKYLKVKDKVVDIKSFYTSLMSKFLLILILAIVNYYINKWSNPWFLWFALGLAFSMIFKAIKAFGWEPFLNKKLETTKK